MERGGSEAQFETKLRGHRPSTLILFIVVWTVLLLASGVVARGATHVLAVRHFSTEHYSRLVFVLNRNSYKFRIDRLNDPPRIFVDIPSGRLKAGFRLPQFSKGSLAQNFRVGRPDSKWMRLIIQLRHAGIRYHAFTLPEPDRIVIDLHEIRSGRENMRKDRSQTKHKSPRAHSDFQARKAKKHLPASTPRTGRERRRISLNMKERFRAGLGIIVLDPGHGGKDPGAVGLFDLNEKYLALNISWRISRSLRGVLAPGNEIFMTRSQDRYISLEARSAFAKKHDADVFISIHANSSPNRSTRGVETYFLAEASTERALKLAARESGTTVSKMSDLQVILNDLSIRSKKTGSQKLAKYVQNAVLLQLRRKYSNIINLGVKPGPFRVLLGDIKMPAILVEMGFLSNRLDAKRLRIPEFQENIAEGIARGILNFIGVSPRRSSNLDGERYLKTSG